LMLGRWTDAERVAKPAEGGAKVELLDGLLARRQALVAKSDLTDRQREAIDHFLCAEFAQDEGRPAEQVETLLAPCFAAGAEFGSAYGLRGLLALERGRFTEALADAERAIAQSPDDARGYFVRGRVRLVRGLDGALADLTKAAELSKRKDARILHWLAA